MPEANAPWLVSLVLALGLIVVKALEQFAKQVDDARVPELIRKIYASELADRKYYLLAAAMYTLLIACIFFGILTIVPFLGEQEQKLLGIDKKIAHAVLPLYVALAMVSVAKLGDWAGVEVGLRRLLHHFASIPQAVMQLSGLFQKSTYDFNRVNWEAARKFCPSIDSQAEWEQMAATATRQRDEVLYAWLVLGSVLTSSTPLGRRATGDINPVEIAQHRGIFAEIRSQFVVLKDKLFSQALSSGISQAAAGRGGSLNAQFRQALAGSADEIFDLEAKLYLYLSCLGIKRSDGTSSNAFIRSVSFLPPDAPIRQTNTYQITVAFLASWFISFAIFMSLLWFEAPNLPNVSQIATPSCLASVDCFTHARAGWPSLRVSDYLRQMVIGNVTLLFTFFLPIAALLPRYFDDLRAQTSAPNYVKLFFKLYTVAAALMLLSVLLERLISYTERGNQFDITAALKDFIAFYHFFRPLPFVLGIMFAGDLLRRSADSKPRMSLVPLLIAVCAGVGAIVEFIFYSTGKFENGSCTLCPQYGAFLAYTVRDTIFFVTFFALLVWLGWEPTKLDKDRSRAAGQGLANAAAT